MRVFDIRNILLIALFLIPSLIAVASNTVNSRMAPDIQVSLSTQTGLNYLSEGCGNSEGNIQVSLVGNATQIERYVVVFSGTAGRNSDFTSDIPDTLNFPIGSGGLGFSLNAISDTLAESPESITITITSLDGSVSVTETIWLFDALNVEIGHTDTLFFCGGTGVTLSATGAAAYAWAPSGEVNPVQGSQTKFTGDTSQWIYVIGNLNGCVGRDSIFLKKDTAFVKVSASDKKLCGPGPVTLTTEVERTGGTYSWQPSSLFGQQQNLPMQTIENLRSSVVVTVTYSLDGCESTDTVHLTVVQGLVYEQPFSDTIVCQNTRIDFGNFKDAPNYQFVPSTNIRFEDPNNPYVNATGNIDYKLIITGVDTSCHLIYNFHIVVDTVDFQAISPDSANLCLGDSTRIEFQVSPASVSVVYTPQDSTIREVSKSEYWLSPAVSTTYDFTFSGTKGCVLKYQSKVRVDSMPDIPLTNWIPKDLYCAGDTVLFTSPEVSKAKYPNITFNWQSIGEVNKKTDANLLVVTQDTFLYIRRTVNVACKREDSIKLNVVQPIILLSLNDTAVCANEPVMVEVKNPVTDIEWDPTTGVDCSNDCQKATVHNAATTTYRIKAKKDGCPAETNFTYNVRPPAQLAISISPEGAIAKGTEVRLKIENPLSGVDLYNWSYNGNSLGSQGTVITAPANENYMEYVAQIGPAADKSNCGAYGIVTLNTVIPYIKIPNAFTPNSDDLNDVFEAVVPGGVEITDLVIVNRWGQQVFHATDNTGWDGKVNGKLAPADTYLFRIRYRFTTGGQEITAKGEVNLIR